MSKSWYSRPVEIFMKDGTSKMEYKYVFETDDAQIGYFIEFMFRCLMDYKSKPKQKTGKWIYDGTSFVSGFEWMHCSECNHADIWAEDTRTNYCPNCGAKMEGESE